MKKKVKTLTATEEKLSLTKDFRNKLVSSPSGFSLDKSVGNSKRVTGDICKYSLEV